MTDTSTRANETLHKSRSAARALQLLDTVITAGPMGLAEAAAAVDLPTSTALRHLRALMDSGYLARDELGQYSVGPTFLRIALAAFRSGPYARLVAAAQPQLERLAAETEETAYVAVRDGTEAVYIATVESPRAIRHVGWVGRSVPIAGTAVGAALLATAAEPGDPPEVEINTGAIESDVTAVCAAIHGDGAAVGALSVLGPADRLAGARLAGAGEAVVEAAVTIATALSSPTDGGRSR
ncbi:MAG: IclR family transcriptional regulator [Ilumatobacteraceae bacterium]